MWNLDESAFNTAEMFDRVVGRKGMKQIYSQFDGTEKELVTILPCGNAAGLQLPFMALFSGKRHVRSRLDDTDGWCYQGVNESGTMDQLHFANYIKMVVFPAMTKMKVSLLMGKFAHDVTTQSTVLFFSGIHIFQVHDVMSVVLQNVIFVDGHFSHINNYTLMKYIKDFEAETGKIVYVFVLPAGQTSHLQPFDISVFGQVKKAWADYLRHRRIMIGGLVRCATIFSLWIPPYSSTGCIVR